MTSYPASCEFMVARPPTYQESMTHFSQTMIRQRNPIFNNTNNILPVIRQQPNILKEDIIELYYPIYRRTFKKRLCNIL
jgi:hypothetical protein